uniref:Immunoglobulin mu heavy chain-like n=1 Tax=Acanthochromis polyacanthus TaxID=80966 RepID=A0A3Q1FKH0_9TELE
PVADDSYAISWIRKYEEKPMDWIFHMWGGGFLNYDTSLRSKFSYSRDMSAGTVTITGQNLQSEDTAVYYCVRHCTMKHCDSFDYWGRGTEVTVTSATPTLPDVFPLVSCKSATENEVTLGCLAYGFYPKSATFMWTNASGTKLDSHQYISYPSNNNTYTGVSVITVSESDSSAYKCSVNHPEGNRSVTVKLSNVFFLSYFPSTGSGVFSPEVTLLSVPSEDKQALVCTIEKLSSETLSVSWKKNGVSETGFMDGKSKKTGDVYSTVSVLKVTKADWDSNAVYTCEVTHDGLTYTKTISKDGTEPKVTVHILPEQDINQEVTLVCLVSSSMLQDYYITWTEDNGQTTGIYTNGINFPPQKTKNGYSVTSLYATTKKKWNDGYMIKCHVWPAGRKDKVKPHGVSKDMGNAIEC